MSESGFLPFVKLKKNECVRKNRLEGKGMNHE